MTAAVSSDRPTRLGIDQIEPWAGNAMRAARLSVMLGVGCCCSL
jgi:hypothetical protein